MNRKPDRLLSLDALRGWIIALMALDHANHFIAQQHSSGEYWGGAFPVYQDTLAFLTRFITHLSAPGFFFLMGTALLLFAHARKQQGWGQWAIIRHFMLRGGLLMALQLLIINRAWELSPSGWGLDIYIGVLFALGGTMIMASLMLWLKPKYLLALTVVFFLATELLTPNPHQWNQSFSITQQLLWIPGGNLNLWVNYPVLPWLKLVTFGMLFGHWIVSNPRLAFKRALWLGITFLLAFGALRALDGFGNIRPRADNTWIAFLNVVKYPPSLTFTLLTTGINLIILWLLNQFGDKLRYLRQPLAVFGQVPLLFYVSHLFLYAALGLWFTPHGTSLPIMYLYWLAGLAILYPLCLGYGRFKQQQSANSIWRFL